VTSLAKAKPGKLKRRSDAENATARVGVIDIGSNSVRLVVYEGIGRAPMPIFNERALCGLGRGLAESGKLNKEGAKMALENMARFVVAAEAMQVGRLEVVATEAVRAAKDGPAFVATLEKRFNIEIDVLKGTEEARASALGVLAGIPAAYGAMGDLGGASLELVSLINGEPGRGISLPIGPFRLMRQWAKDRKKTQRAVQKMFADIAWLGRGRADRVFYPVGGAWRALANIHMQHHDYPLHVIHEYDMPCDEARELLGLVMNLGPSSLARIEGVPKKRLDTLPLAAMVLDCVIERMEPDRLVFSAQGLREGILFDKLTAAQSRKDPLLAACVDVASRSRRFDLTGTDLFNWTSPLFGKETKEQKRLRLAACMLGDIAWNEHPDYRAEQAFWRILRMPVTGVDHPGRAFLALAVGARYGEGYHKIGGEAGERITALIYEEEAERAMILGRALRLAYTLSAGNRRILNATSLRMDAKNLNMLLPKRKGAALVGEMVARRFEGVAKAMGRKPRIVGPDVRLDEK
jgi:exopolyphosphatase / guanosine-5'-triphosphate,3'-diphosphate pyrophosphatase